VHTRWEALYDTFDRFIRGASRDPLPDLPALHASLRGFADVERLFVFLVESNGDLDERDRVLAALLELSRRPATRETATALLWLALWPGLTAIYGRRRRRGTPQDDAVSAIAFAFTTQLQGLDLARVHRVAATLVRNTERIAIDLLRESECIPAAGDVVDEVTAPVTFDDALRSLRGDVHAVAGDDGDLVLAVAVVGESQAEVSARLGITADAGRKRYQRALARLRAA